MFDILQKRMAEMIFQPKRVLKTCWVEGRKASNLYMVAGWIVFLPALGFGIVLGETLSADAFLLDARPTLISNIGLLFVLVWLAFTLYAGFMAVATGLMATFRS